MHPNKEHWIEHDEDYSMMDASMAAPKVRAHTEV